MNVLGIDIGGTKVKTGFVSNAIVSEKAVFSTPKSLEDFSDWLKDTLVSYEKKEAFQHVAFSVPGSVNESGTVFYGGAVPYLNEVNLPSFVASLGLEKSLEVIVENDAKAATIGELAYGHLKGITNGAAVILGTGVGVGLCINGQLYKGSRYQSGEVSFMIRDRVLQDKESFVGVGLSSVGFIKKMADILEVEDNGRLVFRALQKVDKDHPAYQLFQQYCYEAAVLCFNIQCLLDTEKIVIGGGISQQPLLLEMIRTGYKKIIETAPIIAQTIQPMEIDLAAFQADANLIGAAKEFF